MPVLKNPKHERFAQERAKGLDADAAYQKAGYRRDRGNAVRLTTKDSVSARIAEIQGKAETRAVLSIAEKREFLARVMRTPVGEVDHTSPLCQERTFIEGQEETSVKVRMPDKLKAIQLDNDLAADGAEAAANRALEIIIRKL